MRGGMLFRCGLQCQPLLFASRLKMSRSQGLHAPDRKMSLFERVVGRTLELLFIPSELRVRRKMRRSGRCLSWSAFKTMQKGTPGTLIIEDPTVGWNYTCAWWTGDCIADSAPDVFPGRDGYHAAMQTGKIPEWDKWLWENHVSPSTGTAYLLRVWRGSSLKAMFEAQFPTTAIASTWSAVQFFGVSRDDAAEGHGE